MGRRNQLQHAWLIIPVVLAAVGATAQNKLDFSGQWILTTPNRSHTDTPLALTVRQTLVRTTVAGDPIEPFFRDITVERQFATGRHSENHVMGVQPLAPSLEFALTAVGTVPPDECGPMGGELPALRKRQPHWAGSRNRPLD